MSDIMMPILLLGLAGGGIYLLLHKDELLGKPTAPVVAVAPTVDVVKDSSSSQTSTTTTTKGGKTKTVNDPAPTISTGDKYLITTADQKLGPQNCASSQHEADLGFGFSKDGGPVAADGFTADDGEPRVGDNRNNKTMTIAQLPGPCETKPYKGKVQYRYKDLSASCETCVKAKRYYLYKYGIGGVNPIPGTGGEGIREGGKSTGKVVPQKKVGGAKRASFVMVQSPYSKLSL